MEAFSFLQSTDYITVPLLQDFIRSNKNSILFLCLFSHKFYWLCLIFDNCLPMRNGKFRMFYFFKFIEFLQNLTSTWVSLRYQVARDLGIGGTGKGGNSVKLKEWPMLPKVEVMGSTPHRPLHLPGAFFVSEPKFHSITLEFSNITCLEPIRIRGLRFLSFFQAIKSSNLSLYIAVILLFALK